VIAASLDGRLYILNLDDGRKIWQYEIGSELTGSPAVTGGMIFVGSKDGTLYIFR
ncbi:MAG: PQQ-binding-like beta-propeller repeat protein, partial [Kiritimatiellae bacterium]|nr:PQQ-binding-like beta-propeller repeat protein [Kiritimatiellia bacterium]